MAEASSLALLIDLARSQRDQAAARLAMQQLRVQQAQRQADLLASYARDYHARSHDRQQAGGLDPAAAGNLRAFLDKLGGALTQQQAEVAAAAAAAQAALAELQQLERRLRSLEALLERQRLGALALGARREQRATDEMAAQLAQRRADSPA